MKLPTGGMQPASKAAQSVSAAAEALFETKTVTDIRQIEARTRKDIEDKNSQLRQLVGDSYRDLIEGTDKVVDISIKCHAILSNILAIQESFGGLAVGVTAAAGGGSGDSKDFVRKHQELHAVGSRVKYVLDTPEIIWSCLEAQQHLEAAKRLLRVHEVYDQLQAGFAADLAAKFPLLGHQWPLVLKFRQQVLDTAVSFLSTRPQHSSQAAADAVAAIAVLESLDSTSALQRFLTAHRCWTEKLLEAALAVGHHEEQTAGQVLAQLVQQVQSCVAQVGHLFTEGYSASKLALGDGSSHCSLLQQLLQEDEADMTELYFGGVGGSAEGHNSPEAVAWRHTNSSIRQSLVPLPKAEVVQACSSWLLQVSAACNKQGLQLLQQCSSAQSLLEAEQTVQQAILSWAPEAATADEHACTTDAAVAGGSRSTSMAAALAGSAVGAGAGVPGKLSMVRGRHLSEWDTACAQVLGESMQLWQVLFHPPFLARCKQLISAALQDACSSIQQPLAAALQQAAQHEPEPAGQLRPGIWPSMSSSHSSLANGILLDRTYSLGESSGAWSAGGPAAVGHTLSGTIGPLAGTTPSVTQAPADGANTQSESSGVGDFRNEVQNIKQLFDSRLHSTLLSILLLTAAASEPPGSPHKLAHTRSQSLSRVSSLAPAASQALAVPAANSTPAAGTAAAACVAAGHARGNELEQHTQQQCMELVQQLAEQLQQLLKQVQELSQGANSVEQVLVIARVCSAIAYDSSMLPVLLGPSTAWAAAAKAGLTTSSGYTAGSTLPAAIAQGISSLGPAAAALLRMHHPDLMQHSAAAQNVAAQHLQSLQQQLHSIACAGYVIWAKWVSNSLCGALLGALSSDELLHSNITPLSWAHTTIAAEGAEAAGDLSDPLEEPAAAGDLIFPLPAVPSAAMLQMLSWACWETRRAGEHLITTDALQLLQWELHGAALMVLQQVASPEAADTSSVVVTSTSNKSISEKGVLQLLFDQRLLMHVIGAGKPLGATAAGVGGEAVEGQLAARKRLVMLLEQHLQDRLDPIDWATFEPHLWANVQKYHQRTSVLLGTLAQLQKPYSEATRPSAPVGGDCNTLNVLPVAARFQYLPVSTPSALHAAGIARRRLNVAAGVGTAAGGGSGAATAVPVKVSAAAGPLLSLVAMSTAVSDLAAQYVFTDLNSSSGRSKVAAAGQAANADPAEATQAVYSASLHMTADAAAAAGASALSAIQARLQGSSFGAFGSMLGDRAAEVTAIAQNFGDLLPSSGGLGGGLGGLGGGLLSSFARRDGGPSVVTSKK